MFFIGQEGSGTTRRNFRLRRIVKTTILVGAAVVSLSRLGPVTGSTLLR